MCEGTKREVKISLEVFCFVIAYFFFMTTKNEQLIVENDIITIYYLMWPTKLLLSWMPNVSAVHGWNNNRLGQVGQTTYPSQIQLFCCPVMQM